MNRVSKKQVFYLFILFSALSFLQAGSASAADELHLTGKVESVDHDTRKVFVDVTTSSCPGRLELAVENVAAFDNVVGKRISFFIDSSTCSGDQVYNMLPGWREKR